MRALATGVLGTAARLPLSASLGMRALATGVLGTAARLALGPRLRMRALATGVLATPTWFALSGCLGMRALAAAGLGDAGVGLFGVRAAPLAVAAGGLAWARGVGPLPLPDHTGQRGAAQCRLLRALHAGGGLGSALHGGHLGAASLQQDQSRREAESQHCRAQHDPSLQAFLASPLRAGAAGARACAAAGAAHVRGETPGTYQTMTGGATQKAGAAPRVSSAARRGRAAPTRRRARRARA